MYCIMHTHVHIMQLCFGDACRGACLAVPPSLQFGVELELFFPQSVTEEHVASVIPEGWIVKKEESIKCCQDGECQCTPLEVVSPILKGESRGWGPG